MIGVGINLAKMGILGGDAGVGLGVGGGAPSYSAEATAYFAAMSSQPDDTRKAVIDAFITTLVSEGIWAKLDAAGIVRAHDAQAARLWLTDPARSATVVGSPTFTADRGYTGVPSTGYLDSGFNAAVDGSNYTQNDCCFGGYLTPGVGTDTAVTVYMMGSSSSTMRLAPRAVSDTVRARINSASETVSAISAVATRAGLTAAQRTGAALTEVFRNGASVGTDTDASTALASASVHLLTANGSGTVIDNQMGFWWAGGSLTSGQHAALDTAWDTYVAATT